MDKEKNMGLDNGVNNSVATKGSQVDLVRPLLYISDLILPSAWSRSLRLQRDARVLRQTGLRRIRFGKY